MSDRTLSVMAHRCNRQNRVGFRCLNVTYNVVNTAHGAIHDCGQHNP